MNNMIIPVGIIAAENDEIIISVATNKFPDFLTVFLEDKTTGEFINLSENTYEFQRTGKEIGRFYIHTKILNNYTWSGGTNNNWGLADNWNENAVPLSNANVIIPSESINNYPTLSSSVEINSLRMDPLSTLITNGFDITGTVTYKNSLTSNWHLIASPIIGETVSNFVINNTLTKGTGVNIGIVDYDNNKTSPWVYKTSSSTGNLASGAGFAVKLNNDGYISFSGNINTTDVNYTITNGEVDNFNLIGNPFTTYINSKDFTNTNKDLLTEETIWLWNGTKYETHNITTPIEIAPTQGFFVSADTAGSVTFTTENQSHQTTNTFKKQNTYTHFELFVEKETDTSSTKIFFINGNTTDFDNGYDSSMFGSATYDFAVFTELVTNNEGKKLAIQTLPENYVSKIPVGIIAKAGEELTFSMESFNLPEGTDIYIEDTVNNEFVNISETSYKTNLTEDPNGVGQFYITTSAKILSTIDEILDTVSVYKSSSNELTVTGKR